MSHNQFEHLFGEIHTRSIGDTFNAERHGLSSGWNHEFSMIRIFLVVWLSGSEIALSHPLKSQANQKGMNIIFMILKRLFGHKKPVKMLWFLNG
jgi:hypothetical protein